jgi:hypothetical protein
MPRAIRGNQLSEATTKKEDAFNILEVNRNYTMKITSGQ